MSDKQETPCRYALASTVLGWVGILASSRGIRRLTLPQASPSLAVAHLELSKWAGASQPIQGAFPDIEKRLERYFLGEQTSFPPNMSGLDVEGTAFQKRAWEVARTIPWGETRSYTWVAHNMGHPGAARAVGQAMRANPVPIIVPCHRVIGSDGRMCGYGGPDGVDLKRKLLDMERGHRDWQQAALLSSTSGRLRKKGSPEGQSPVDRGLGVSPRNLQIPPSSQEGGQGDGREGFFSALLQQVRATGFKGVPRELNSG